MLDKKYYENKNKDLNQKFNQVNQQLAQLASLKEQIKGQYTLLEEQEKEFNKKDNKDKK